MSTYPAVTTTNMELTPMMVKFKGPGALTYVDLGGTLGNVVITAKYAKADIKADQLGITVLNRKVSGVEISVTTELTEIKNKDIWKVIFPHATEVTTGTKAIKFNTNVGDDDLTNAGELLLHPLSDDAAGVDTDYTFWKVCASAESSITYGPTEQAKLKIVWNVLPDVSVTPARFFTFGDTTL